jgi:hypothetical protein
MLMIRAAVVRLYYFAIRLERNVRSEGRKQASRDSLGLGQSGHRHSITMDLRNAVEGSNSVGLRNAFSRAKPTSVVGRRAEDICSH